MNEQLERDDEALVAQVKAHWAPPPMTSTDDANFDAALRARIEARTQRRLWWGMGLAVVAAAAVALMVTRGAVEGPSTAPQIVAEATDGFALDTYGLAEVFGEAADDADSWDVQLDEDEVIDAFGLGELMAYGDDSLPPDYEMLAVLVLPFEPDPLF